MPNGPEAASAFLALASCSACAPLNPALRKSDFEAAFRSLRAEALLVESGVEGPAAEAAHALGIRLLRLRKGGPAGWFDLVDAGEVSELDWPGSDDTALLLHTSGTTSRPKLVPLTGANLCASARHIAQSLALTAGDRCLNILPLFHIHGLAATLLATLASGGGVVLTDGVYAAGFFEWLEQFQPTWYTAVPTMHQGILAGASRHRAVLEAARLRFVRSSSAPLPKSVAAALEDAFRAPLIEAYGMTEAAHQIASNRFRPLNESSAPSAFPQARKWPFFPRPAEFCLAAKPAGSAKLSSAVGMSPPGTRTMSKPTPRRLWTAGSARGIWDASTRMATCT